MTKRTVLITADVLPPVNGTANPGFVYIDSGLAGAPCYVHQSLVLTPDRIRAMLEIAGLGELFTADGQFVSSERLAQALGVVGDTEQPDGGDDGLVTIPEGFMMAHKVDGRITLVFCDVESETPGATGIEWRDKAGVIHTETFPRPLPFANEGDVVHRAGELWVRA